MLDEIFRLEKKYLVGIYNMLTNILDTLTNVLYI